MSIRSRSLFVFVLAALLAAGGVTSPLHGAAGASLSDGRPPGTPAAAAEPVSPEPGDGVSGYTPLNGAKVSQIKLKAGQPKRVKVTGRAGVPASGVLAAALEVTANGADGAGALLVQNPDTGQPSTPVVQFSRGRASTAMAAVKVNSGGEVVLTSSKNLTVRLDAVGWFDEFAFLSGNPASGSQFHAVDAARLATTEKGDRLGPGQRITVQATGRSGIPAADVTAVAVSVTALRPAGRGRLVAHPDGNATSTPVVSYSSGAETQLAFVKVGNGGRFTLRAMERATHVRVVAVGYFQEPGDDIVTGQSSLIPAKTLLAARLGDGAAREVKAAGVGRIPEIGVQSLLVTIAVSGAKRAGRLVLHRAGDPATKLAVVTYRKGRSTSTTAIAPLSFQDGQLVARNAGGPARVRLSAIGWHAWVIPPPPTPPGPPPGRASGEVAPPPGLDDTVVHLRQDPKEVDAYWTPERLARARSNPAPLPGGPDTDFDDSGVVYPGYDSYQSGYLPAASYDARVGRLYYTVGGVPNSCSATLVARNMLITAAHCVSGRANFIWEAGQIGGQTSGTWAASGVDYYLAYDEGWPPLDYAVVILPPTAEGYYPGDYYGWFPIYAGTANAPVLMEGYPAEGWFESNCPAYTNAAYPSCYVWYNYSAIFNYYNHQNSGWYEYVIGGYINGGASGGPFFQYINGQWYVTGVVSHGDNTIVNCAEVGVPGCARWFGENTWSPYFNQWVIDLWRAYAVT